MFASCARVEVTWPFVAASPSDDPLHKEAEMKRVAPIAAVGVAFIIVWPATAAGGLARRPQAREMTSLHSLTPALRGPTSTPRGAQSIRGNSVTFPDSTNEDPAAPDIISVVVSNDDSGLITIQINIANRPQLTSDMDVTVYFDTDRSSTNGAGKNFEGAELGIDLTKNGVALARWNGSKFDFSGGSPSSLIFSYANGATFKVKASDLGLTDFNFFVAAGSGPESDFHIDFAPDAGHGTWNYQIKVAPTTRSQLKLATERFGTDVYPKRPKAPEQLVAYLLVRRLDTGKQIRTGQVLCRATIGGRALETISGGFFRGTVNCNWELPKSARGKTVKGSITITFQGAKISRPFSVRIG